MTESGQIPKRRDNRFCYPEAVGHRAPRCPLVEGQIVLRNAVGVGTAVVAAQLLSPGDYGLTGMVAMLTTVLLVCLT